MGLVVDTCAAVHALGMVAAGRPLLATLDVAAGQPRYATTNAVRTEIVAHGAGSWLDGVEKAGRLDLHPNSAKACRRAHEALRRRHGARIPGIKDVGLLELARETASVLITDDGAFYRVALAEGVAVLDLFDVCLAAEHFGLISSAEADTHFDYLQQPSPFFHPFGWMELARAGQTWPAGSAALRASRRPAEHLAALLRPPSTAGGVR